MHHNTASLQNHTGTISFVDTHCHINMMIKDTFDVPLEEFQLAVAPKIIQEAAIYGIHHIINVGTSLSESMNSIELARRFSSVWATVGIHPNDCTTEWRSDFQELTKYVRNAQQHKIVGIGECGIDCYRPGYDLARQTDAFKAHIELALAYNLPLVVHSRHAYEETLRILEEYKHDNIRGIMHCFSYDSNFAHAAIAMNFVLGIGGTVTYPKNEQLRAVVQEVGFAHIVLETDAPFLPPQHIRGQKNHPLQIRIVAEYIAKLLNVPIEEVARITTDNACTLFQLTMA